MTLGQAQREFARCVGLLIAQAYKEGYELSLGEAWRSTATARVMAEQGRGIATSLHVDRLAIDLNLFRDGEWLPGSEAHRPLGTYWKTLNPLARWGGDFARPDGNHYSFTWNGRS